MSEGKKLNQSGLREQAKAMTDQILENLRLRIIRSDLTQRAIESRIGFSRGYLSQLLGGTVEIKYWQLLAILRVMGLDPAEFFGELFPRRRSRALEQLDDVASKSDKGSLSFELARLFSFGIESIHDMYARLERCEKAVDELDQLGLFDESERDPP